MPHAEKDVMGEPVVNGDHPQSQFINHLASYPFVSGSLENIKANPYGQKSLELADQGYSQFAKPFLPYLAKPYGYVAPYVSKADELGNEGLNRMDSTIPAVIHASENIKETIRGYVSAPFRLAEDGKGYVLETYSSERNAVGDGSFSRSKAAVSTGLRLTADSCLWLRGYLIPEAKTNEAAKNGKPRRNGEKAKPAKS
ncbi:hypothetical protein D8B26_003057 [Coccidioides posadasii str. Silveira]|nr:hypothetical protein CPC735_007270 [Coccidioides posadasii C735 delta SOWgp]EER26554.1 hypothetical protein CPC735_007270 [Coccidioides posadasii C735 delta SOWgp]KMM72843.1 CAP20 protein [Coccidioides posadasii RMSCC 3488]QVM08366.1 hypothetical protein D8B26_003057 [Coccidioides posadasii str. Silveira]|eukprot:XP_003068699.1 hypothetical protein CPC735_007270 [Coccidioides posadasii C735 delta SOWgp]